MCGRFSLSAQPRTRCRSLNWATSRPGRLAAAASAWSALSEPEARQRGLSLGGGASFVAVSTWNPLAPRRQLDNLAGNQGVFVMGVHGTQPVVPVGDDDLPVSRISHQ